MLLLSANPENPDSDNYELPNTTQFQHFGCLWANLLGRNFHQMSNGYSDSPIKVKAAQLRGEEYFAFVVSMACLNAVALSSFCSLFL